MGNLKDIVESCHEKNKASRACVEILDRVFSGTESSSEVKILEDVYQLDAAKAFEEYNQAELGIPGLRLDLFYASEEEVNNGIQEEKETTSSE